jgi:alpha-glucuronidase
MSQRFLAALLVASLGPAVDLHAETGYDLWLRYRPLADGDYVRSVRPLLTAIVPPTASPTHDVTVSELRRGLGWLLGADVPTAPGLRDGALVLGTPKTSRVVAGLGWGRKLRELGLEGYLIRSTRIAGHPATVIASAGETGVLYGAFHSCGWSRRAATSRRSTSSPARAGAAAS